MSTGLWQLCPLRAPCWRGVLDRELAAHPQVESRLAGFLAERLDRLLPGAPLVFAALESTPLALVQVLILGQDPYPTPGDAHGLAFSVQRRSPLPRSLANVLAEVERDTGARPTGGDLSGWAADGVLLLNSVLTFERPAPGGAARPHRDVGWELLGEALLRAVISRSVPLVVMAWGRQAADAVARVQATGAGGGPLLVLQATHPSPLSCRRPARGLPAFHGCGHFSAANAFLRRQGACGISWQRTAPAT